VPSIELSADLSLTQARLRIHKMKRRDFIRLGVAAAFMCNFAAGQEMALKSGPGDRTHIYVDPRIEMYSVVLYLSDFKGLKNEDGVIEARVITELDFAYRREVDSNLNCLRGPMGILESRKLPLQVIERIKNLGIWDVHITDQTSEYILRAVTKRLAFNKLGPEKGQRALEDEISQGFPHLDVICQCLEQYEKQRGKYPTLKDYFPQIVSVFAGLAEKPAANRSRKLSFL